MGMDLIPAPSDDLVPDGWWQKVVVPWADDHGIDDIVNADAQVAGLIAAYDTLGADTLELTKARRYLEVRLGELLGDARMGRPPSSAESSRASELSKDDRARFRQLAQARAEIVALLAEADDPELVTRAACLRLWKATVAPSPRAASEAVSGMIDDDDPASSSTPDEPQWDAAHERKRQRIALLLEETLDDLAKAAGDGLRAYSRAELLRSAEIKARTASSELGAMAFGFGR